MSWRSRRMNGGRCMETKMELFTFALVIWVIYLGLAVWPESEKSQRGENGGKGVRGKSPQAFKYVKKAAAEEVLDLYGQLFPPMSKAA
jgi:hypothetical protein